LRSSRRGIERERRIKRKKKKKEWLLRKRKAKRRIRWDGGGDAGELVGSGSGNATSRERAH